MFLIFRFCVCVFRL